MQHFFTTALLALLATPLALTQSTSENFYDIVIYADSACSIMSGGISGNDTKECAALRGPAVGIQSSFFEGSCSISFYSDPNCCDQVTATTSPPNLNCVSGGNATYYDVACQ